MSKKPKTVSRVVDIFPLNGDVVITDPCYIRDFVEPSHSRDTLYGDWGCSVWDYNPLKADGPKKGQKRFGQFCADGGMVCVETLDEKQKRRLKRWLKDHEWCATLIENFEGIVEYVETTEPVRKPKGVWGEYTSLSIRGRGFKNGFPYAFVTAQTGL